ncbi:MAG: maleylacetoacetate isomerase [Acidiferrobacterales bacterium]
MQDVARLYQATNSSSSWRIRIALALKAIAYDPVWIDLHAGEHLAAAYASLSPTRQVPCLEIDGQRLFQTVAIIEYLEETRPLPPLLPADALQRSRVRSLVEVVNSAVQPMHNFALRERLREQFGATDVDTRVWCRYWIERRFEDLNRIVDSCGGTYSLGDSVTAADVFLYPQVRASRQFAVDMSRFPAIERVMSALERMPAFKGSDPPVSSV